MKTSHYPELASLRGNVCLRARDTPYGTTNNPNTNMATVHIPLSSIARFSDVGLGHSMCSDLCNRRIINSSIDISNTSNSGTHARKIRTTQRRGKFLST